MASYTPNLNLKKPAYGDTADIADINSNMDKIDTVVGKLQKYTEFTNIASQAAFDNALDSVVSAMAGQSVSFARIATTADFGMFFSGGSYFVTVSKAGGTTYAYALISRNGDSATLLGAGRDTDGWKYHDVAKAYHSMNTSDIMTRVDGGTNSGVTSMVNKVITVSSQMGNLSLIAGEQHIATMTKYYPTAGSVHAVGYFGAGSALGSPVRIRIDNDGKVYAISGSAGNSTLRFSVTYVCNQDF